MNGARPAPAPCHRRERAHHRLASALLSLLSVAGCVDAGDRKVTAAEASEGAGCAEYCEAVEETGCDAAECETTCNQLTDGCPDEFQSLLECRLDHDVACLELESGAEGPPLSPNACDDALRDFEECDGKASFNPDALQCAQSETKAECTECCQEWVDGPFEKWFQSYGDCLCQPSACATECEDWCEGGDASDDCRTCTAATDRCEAEADVRCAARLSCSAYVECLEDQCADKPGP